MPSAFLKKLKIGIDFSESFAIIITLSLQGSKQLYQQRSTGTAMEKSPSWSRAHDWKSCRPLKGLEGSNPSFSAISEQATCRLLRLFYNHPCRCAAYQKRK